MEKPKRKAKTTPFWRRRLWWLQVVIVLSIILIVYNYLHFKIPLCVYPTQLAQTEEELFRVFDDCDTVPIEVFVHADVFADCYGLGREQELACVEKTFDREILSKVARIDEWIYGSEYCPVLEARVNRDELEILLNHPDVESVQHDNPITSHIGGCSA